MLNLHLARMQVHLLLEEVDLSGCNIGAAATSFIGVISNAFATNSGGGSQLRRLNLAGNKVEAITAKGLTAAAQQRPGFTLTL